MNNYQLYRHRSVSDNVNMVFDFVGENWKKWLKMMVYFLLPFSVILGIAIATFYSDTETSMSSTAYVLFIVLFILGSAVATALEMLRREGLLEKLREKVWIGQGCRGKSGNLGVGNCTAMFAHTLQGCPPTEGQMYEFLRNHILTGSREAEKR